MGDKFGMGIDDTHMKLRGAPVLDEPALSAHQKMIADKLTVSELMTVSMIALPPVAKVSLAVPSLLGLTRQLERGQALCFGGAFHRCLSLQLRSS